MNTLGQIKEPIKLTITWKKVDPDKCQECRKPAEIKMHIYGKYG